VHGRREGRPRFCRLVQSETRCWKRLASTNWPYRLICITMPKNRPWDPAEDDLLQKLITEGRYAVDIAVEMSRSESAVRLRAKILEQILIRHGHNRLRRRSSGTLRAVKAVRAMAIALFKASIDLAAAFRSAALSLAKAISIGLRSGE